MEAESTRVSEETEVELNEPTLMKVNGVNGKEGKTVTELEIDLSLMRNEKETFEGQYRALLGKLTSMRNTLGDKLKQDADELDIRAETIKELNNQNEELMNLNELLKDELNESDATNATLSTQLESFRNRAQDDQKLSTEESLSKEVAFRELEIEFELSKLKLTEWEQITNKERVSVENGNLLINSLTNQLEINKLSLKNTLALNQSQSESIENLHNVLEEFQAAKDRELQSTTAQLQAQLQSTTTSLQEYKQRTIAAEANLKAVQNDSEKVIDLTREVKEKNLLVGKLRHEAVIQNEHLTEALRRLKKDSNENSVDRRLVSNVLITFLNTPRADTKRFEMLNLISSILSWGDEQREMVGLQKTVGGAVSSSMIGGGGGGGRRGHSRSGKSRAQDDGLGENETFSALWIEFLLREVGPGSTTATPPSLVSPISPGGALSPEKFQLSDLPPLAEIPLRIPPRRASLIDLVRGNPKSPTGIPPVAEN